MKARAIPCSHKPATRSDYTVLLLLAQPSSFCHRKMYLKELYIYIYIYIYTPDQLKAEITLYVTSLFLVQFVIFKNAFTFGR